MDKAQAVKYAREFAPEAEGILGVQGVQAELDKVLNGETPSEQTTTKSLDSLADISSIASALIALFAAIGQIRQGQMMRGASREDMVTNLTARILSSSDLSEDTKERLVLASFKLLDPKS